MPDNAVYPLDEQLCFSLYSAHIAINRLYKPMLDRMGITYPQYLVLSTLGENDGITIGAIAERLSLESSTITPPVKRLEQAGLVERTRSKADERQVHVSLTKAGWALIRESKCLGDTLMERSGMTTAEFSAFNRQIRSFIKAVGKEA
ncbi:MAG: MarR family transcriptional regulator [Alphaproteobacteria bacterium]|jgi:MarR family transcriptional regulator, organic hydroperoxide resistance regulator|nr:MarR family transcriptional regulator [Alphaproteobacteria bacterium]MBU1548678.1 MarR family transcriptional regulator [Alphaproteobacteria bacterium]MBU2335504.1 MarR family transcriptional regulator [Alphaproteobacteria bacterium]MBU2391101.1 MarR family transcriptional regulator [Alphaproteobacteria bacterium]